MAIMSEPQTIAVAPCSSSWLVAAAPPSTEKIVSAIHDLASSASRPRCVPRASTKPTSLRNDGMKRAGPIASPIL